MNSHIFTTNIFYGCTFAIEILDVGGNTMELRKIDEEMSSNLNNQEIELLKQATKPKYQDGQKVKYAGIITSIKKKYTKNNKKNKPRIGICSDK